MSNVDTPDYSASSRTAGTNYLLFQGGATVTPGNNFTTPALYAGAFETVTVKMQNSTPKKGHWFVAWYQDEALTELANVDPTYFTANAVNNLVSLSVKAPYMYARVVNDDAANGVWGLTVQGILGSSAPGDAFPPQVLTDSVGVSIGASSTISVLLSLCFAGPCTIMAQGSAGGWIRLSRWNGTAWVPSTAAYLTSGQPITQAGIITGDDTRAEITNQNTSPQTIGYSVVHGG